MSSEGLLVVVGWSRKPPVGGAGELGGDVVLVGIAAR
jgi:hypothetical protein